MYALSLIASFLLGYEVGSQFLKIRESLNHIKNSIGEKKAVPTVVTPIKDYPKREESSLIVEPKSPQQIEFEESQELKRLNPGRYS